MKKLIFIFSFTLFQISNVLANTEPAQNQCTSCAFSEQFTHAGAEAPLTIQECRANLQQARENVQNRLTNKQSIMSSERNDDKRASLQSEISQIQTQSESLAAIRCDTCCSDPQAVAAKEAEATRRAEANRRAGLAGVPKAINMGEETGNEVPSCHPPAQWIPEASPNNGGCLSLLTGVSEGDIGQITENNETKYYFEETSSVDRVDFEDPRSFMSYFNGSPVEPRSLLATYRTKITPIKVCRLIASGCRKPSESINHESYVTCLNLTEEKYKRAIKVGIEKSLAIVAAAKETTEFESDDNYGGMPFECKGNKGDNGGLGFDHPKCKTFYNWYVGLEATTQGFDVGNEAAKITTNMRNQTKMAQQMAEGNGQDAGFDASRDASITAQKAEERNMAFYTAKGATILAQLRNWPNRKNVCDLGCCDLFTAEGADRIDRDFFPNADAKNHIYAQAIAAATQVMVAKFKANFHRDNAKKVQAIKEQMQFADESDEGVMKFCVQFPQDVRCLSPGQRRAMGASGTQFGSFQGTNFGLGSLEGEQATDINAGQNFDGNLSAGGTGSVANIGDANKEAAAAKDIFRAPPAARAGGGGGMAAGAGGGGGGGGGSAQSGQLSRDEGLKEEKKEAPIEITGKKATFEGGKGAYNGGGYVAGNKKPEPAAANPFASMFGKDKGRDPANVAEIDKPASDLFAKISRRYGEVQKRKGLIDVADEGQSGIR